MPDQPAPGVAARAVFTFGLIDRFHHIIGDGRLHDRLQCGTDGDGAPWGRARQVDGGIVAAHAFHLTGIREGDGVALALLIVAQVSTYVVAANTCLTDEHPTIGSDTEQAGEGITFTECRRGVDGCISLIFLLIRGLGLGEAYHWLALRTDKAGSRLREVEGSSLTLDNDTVRVLILILQQGIAESDIIV